MSRDPVHRRHLRPGVGGGDSNYGHAWWVDWQPTMNLHRAVAPRTCSARQRKTYRLCHPNRAPAAHADYAISFFAPRKIHHLGHLEVGDVRLNMLKRRHQARTQRIFEGGNLTATSQRPGRDQHQALPVITPYGFAQAAK